jgi:hypothetical protein
MLAEQLPRWAAFPRSDMGKVLLLRLKPQRVFILVVFLESAYWAIPSDFNRGSAIALSVRAEIKHDYGEARYVVGAFIGEGNAVLTGGVRVVDEVGADIPQSVPYPISVSSQLRCPSRFIASEDNEFRDGHAEVGGAEVLEADSGDGFQGIASRQVSALENLRVGTERLFPGLEAGLLIGGGARWMLLRRRNPGVSSQEPEREDPNSQGEMVRAAGTSAEYRQNPPGPPRGICVPA